jgi:hypothetical protein
MSKQTVQTPENTPPYKKATLKPISDFTVEEGFNNRQDFGITSAEVERFKRSYEQDPYNIPPVTGYKSGKTIILTDGERRLRLAQKAGIPSLPFIPSASDLLSRLESQATRNSGKPFTDVENANLCQALSAAFIADNPDAKAGDVKAYVTSVMAISPASYYNYLKLFEAPADVQEAVAQDQISMKAVREIMSDVDSPEAVSEAVAEAINTAQAEAAAGPAAKPGKGNRKKKSGKATSKTRKNAKKKKTPFAQKSYSAKLTEVLGEIIDSGTPGAQLLIQLDAALKGDTSLEDTVALVVEANLSPQE